MRFITLFDPYIIKSRDIKRLILHSDNEELINLLEWVQAAMSRGLYITICTEIIATIVFSLLIYDISTGFLNLSWSIFFVVLFALIEFMAALIANRYIFYPAAFLSDGILSSWLATISALVPYHSKRCITDFSTNLSGYYLSLYNFAATSFSFVVTLVVIYTSAAPNVLKLSFLFISIILILIMSFFGNTWIKVNQLTREKYIKLELLSGDLLFKRMAYPMVTNTVGTIILPITILLLTKFNINTLIVQATALAGIVRYSWTLIETLHRFQVANDSLKRLIQLLDELVGTYIINHAGYVRLAEMCAPDEHVLSKSFNDMSFVIKDFVPMAITNEKEITHIFNFEFKPGVYQLNGVNGVGKTTFLESLTLPENTRVEFSKGQLALQGKPFFDANLSIEQHRHKYIYIGTNAAQLPHSNFELTYFEKYPNIAKFLIDSKQENHAKHSEGEKSVLLICEAYQQSVTNGVKLIFIDEALSRIYDSDIIPLRREIIGLIKELSEKQGLIILVVDHMTKLEYASQLHMTKKQIDQL